jgi:TetR/AcrR family transcriptional regulator
MAESARLTPRAERTRRAILAAAEEHFAARGLAGTRLEDIAETVGIRRASIVYYFRDKHELYDAVLAEVVGGFRQHLEEALAGGDAPLPKRIEAAVVAWVDYVAARPALARLVLREVAGATPGRPPALLRHTGPFFELIRELQREHRDDPLTRGSPADAVHIASTIAGATVFFFAAMPSLLPGSTFDPLDATRIESHKREVLEITRHLLDSRRRTRRQTGRGRRRGVQHARAR